MLQIKKEWITEGKVNSEKYLKLYNQSIEDSDLFWNEHGERIDWYKKYTKVKNVKYSRNEVNIKWYEDGQLNATYSCIDRHANKYPDKIAIIWEGDNPNDTKKITYKELLLNVSRAANVLKKIGVKKGDRVTIYLTMIPELAYIMLACARIGAVHSIIFGGFSAESIAGRIQDCGSEYIVTADEGVRGGKHIPLKETTDKALDSCPNVKKCLIINRTSKDIQIKEGRDVFYNEAIKEVKDFCEPEVLNAEDPLFILYTSGSTGKPKGVMHTTGGYLVYASMTHEYIFNYKKDDIYWCTAILVGLLVIAI